MNPLEKRKEDASPTLGEDSSLEKEQRAAGEVSENRSLPAESTVENEQGAPQAPLDLSAIEGEWISGRLQPGQERKERRAASQQDFEAELEYWRSRQRRVLAPRFLFILAAGLVVLASDSLLDLRWHLGGPSEQAELDLGSPGNWHPGLSSELHPAWVHPLGVRAKISAFAGKRRGHFRRGGQDYEILSLKNLPVLVQRIQGEGASSEWEVVEARGRLLYLDDAPSGWFGRWFHPTSRYLGARDQFRALGELPSVGPSWLLLDGELPRGHAGALFWPTLTLVVVLALLLAGLKMSFSQKS